MAGVKGRSGGARPGAGRKPKPKPPAGLTVEPQIAARMTVAEKREKAEEKPATTTTDMLQWLQDVALGRIEAKPMQVRAAIAAVQYTHAKKGEGGKKEAAASKAKEVAAGSRFGARPAPLKLVGGG